MAGWHHWLDGSESEWTLGVGDGQGGLACFDSWGCKESDMTERLNWLNWTEYHLGKCYTFSLKSQKNLRALSWHSGAWLVISEVSFVWLMGLLLSPFLWWKSEGKPRAAIIINRWPCTWKIIWDKIWCSNIDILRKPSKVFVLHAFL